MNHELLQKEEIEIAIGSAIGILHANLPLFTENFQDSNSENNFYQPTGNTEWTTGFCTGEYWLAYEMTSDAAFKQAALTQVESFNRRIIDKIEVNHHDMGFLYTPSCVAAYKLVGDETAKNAALLAADNLMERFMEKGQFLQAWGNLGDQSNYRLIIDCLLNLPLLFWAAEVTLDANYADIATKHMDTALKNLVREDNSTYHTYFFDTKTGLPTHGATHQGFRDGSAWARGQAWGVYGLALCYKYTKQEKCISLFKAVTDFFIAKLPTDLVCYWDLDFVQECDEPKDSSAAAIAVCGMLEMCKYLDEKDAAYYRDIAHKILKSLIDNYAAKDISASNGLLLHGTYAKKSPYNTVNNRGVDECNTWGDYFYLEALVRLSTDWELYW